MLKKILKILGVGIDTTTKTVSKSFKSIDTLIENEYITSSIDKAKGYTGELVQKAGEIYENGKIKVEELTEEKSYLPIGEVIETYKENMSQIKKVLKDKIENVTEIFTRDEEE